LSEARVCQLHKLAIERLRTVAQSWMRAVGPRDEPAMELRQ
jgi:hypothetical protein